MLPTFDLQGHRGARGLKPENTLPSFEAAFDAGVTSVETDLHLTRDGVVVLWHDPRLGGAPWHPAEESRAVSGLSLKELRRYRADRNLDPARFPDQDAAVTPLVRLFAEEHGLDPYALPTLTDLFRFAEAYAGEMGARAGKTGARRAAAGRVRFDLELKRLPFFPETINDGYGGRAPGLLERRVVEAVQEAGVAGRTTVRSFDHRCVCLLREMEPRLTGALLVAGTAPLDPAELVRRAGARIYCPRYDFLDEDLVRRAHDGGALVLPWTVNEPAHWDRLLDWGVDGLTTDFPDRLARFLETWREGREAVRLA